MVNAPYHSIFMTGATEKLINEGLKGKELWSTDELAISVSNTEDGEHLFLCSAMRANLSRCRF